MFLYLKLFISLKKYIKCAYLSVFQLAFVQAGKFPSAVQAFTRMRKNRIL